MAGAPLHLQAFFLSPHLSTAHHTPLSKLNMHLCQTTSHNCTSLYFACVKLNSQTYNINLCKFHIHRLILPHDCGRAMSDTLRQWRSSALWDKCCGCPSSGCERTSGTPRKKMVSSTAGLNHVRCKDRTVPFSSRKCCNWVSWTKGWRFSGVSFWNLGRFSIGYCFFDISWICVLCFLSIFRCQGIFCYSCFQLFLLFTFSGFRLFFGIFICRTGAQAELKCQ